MAFKKKYKKYILTALIPVIFLLIIFVPLAAGSNSNVYAHGYGFKVGEEIKNSITIYGNTNLTLLSYLEHNVDSVVLEYDEEINDISAVYRVSGAVDIKLDAEYIDNAIIFRDMYKTDDGAIYVKPMKIAASIDSKRNPIAAEELKGGWIEFSIITNKQINLKVVINNTEEKS